LLAGRLMLSARLSRTATSQPTAGSINDSMNPAASDPVGSVSRVLRAPTARNGATKSWPKRRPAPCPRRSPQNPKPQDGGGSFPTARRSGRRAQPIAAPTKQVKQPDEDVRVLGRPLPQVLGLGGKAQEVTDRERRAGRYGRHPLKRMRFDDDMEFPP
jgi:hypothetical protein